MKLSYLVVVAALLASPSVGAQIGNALGKPLPSLDLPVGTVVVRVVDASVTVPAPKLTVTLTVGKKTQSAETDASGRAKFENLAVGATARVKIVTKAPTGTSESFTIPDTGGVRVMLSKQALREPARTLSGRVIPVESATDAAEVQLTYDNVYDTKPPAGVMVSLVAYAADDSVRVQQSKADAKGVARFAKLDSSGAVAYFALAQLPRNKAVDRLLSEPFVLEPTAGVRVTLSSELRTEKKPPIDELATRDRQNATAPAIAKGKLRVQLEGAVDPNTAIEVLDAATGKSVVKRTAADKDVTLAVPTRANQVLYVTATTKYGIYRSLPLQMVGDRGAQVAIYVFPRVISTFDTIAFADENALVVDAAIRLSNNSWTPYAPKGGRVTVPLPRGATKIELASADQGRATIRDGSIEMLRPLPPGDANIEVVFELPAKKGVVDWSLDLPDGTFQSSFLIEQEPGLSVDHLPAGVRVDTKTTAGGAYDAIEDITITPKQAMTFTVRLPKPGPGSELRHACRRLRPDATPLVGKPIDFALSRIDGGTVKLSGLRGKPVLVNLMATWDMLSSKERPKLATLAKQVPKLAIVMVASDRDAKEVTSTVGKLPFPTVLDPPAKPDDNIGVVTSSWGVVALPESVLVDASGIVRYHFQNSRDWDEPEALRCVKAFVGK